MRLCVSTAATLEWPDMIQLTIRHHIANIIHDLPVAKGLFRRPLDNTFFLAIGSVVRGVMIMLEIVSYEPFGFGLRTQQ